MGGGNKLGHRKLRRIGREWEVGVLDLEPEALFLHLPAEKPRPPLSKVMVRVREETLALASGFSFGYSKG